MEKWENYTIHGALADGTSYRTLSADGRWLESPGDYKYFDTLAQAEAAKVEIEAEYPHYTVTIEKHTDED